MHQNIRSLFHVTQVERMLGAALDLNKTSNELWKVWRRKSRRHSSCSSMRYARSSHRYRRRCRRRSVSRCTWPAYCADSCASASSRARSASRCRSRCPASGWRSSSSCWLGAVDARSPPSAACSRTTPISRSSPTWWWRQPTVDNRRSSARRHLHTYTMKLDE